MIRILLHDDVAGAGRDDALDVRQFMAGKNHEPPGVRADLLVLADRQLDEPVAPDTGAFAAEADWSVLVPGPLTSLDALVDIADRRFGGARTLLLLLFALHNRIFSRRATPRQRGHVRRDPSAVQDVAPPYQQLHDQRELILGGRAGELETGDANAEETDGPGR